MAKPILIIKLKEYANNDISYKDKLSKSLENKLGNEYHILLVFSIYYTEPTFECLNDCKGLRDVDIEQIINEFKEEMKNAPNPDI